MFKDKILLITGGTGSFGTATLKRFIDTDIREIRIFSRDEEKQEFLRRSLGSDKVKFFIGDVRDKDSMRDAIKEVNYIFHAAALKQVPSCEFFPKQAIMTNVLGTSNVLDIAEENQVEKVIVLSTDKSVSPINTMGLTKALAEKMMIAKSRLISDTCFLATRYGNVLGSRGSVLPLFIKQIKEGKDITITNGDMTRFLLTLDDAIDLVLYAFKNGESGDLFVKKAPACTIGVMAEALISLFNSNTKIKVIGIRHGEKLHESLLTCEELSVAKDLGDFFVVKPDSRDLNYDGYWFEGAGGVERTPDQGYSSDNTIRLNIEQVKELLMTLPIVKGELK
jgi:UDP-glucose 4-epimerase